MYPDRGTAPPADPPTQGRKGRQGRPGEDERQAGDGAFGTNGTRIHPSAGFPGDLGGEKLVVPDNATGPDDDPLRRQATASSGVPDLVLALRRYRRPACAGGMAVSGQTQAGWLNILRPLRTSWRRPPAVDSTQAGVHWRPDGGGSHKDPYRRIKAPPLHRARAGSGWGWRE